MGLFLLVLIYCITILKNKSEQKARVVYRFSQVVEKQKSNNKSKKHNDNNCFQYALTAALNYQNITSHLERVSNHKPFIDQYNWKERNFPPEQEKDWKKFESNNKLIALSILFLP